MTQDRPVPTDPILWLRHLFNGAAVRDGGVFLTTRAEVEDHCGLEAFRRHVQSRGFRALENAGHIVVFCNTAKVVILKPRRAPAGG